MINLVTLLEDTEKLAENFQRSLAALRYFRTEENLDDVHDAENEWLYACELATVALDRVDDNEVRMGLMLHYVNGCPWSQVAAELGAPDIKAKCGAYLKTDGSDIFG